MRAGYWSSTVAARGAAAWSAATSRSLQPLGVRALGAFPRKSERGLHSGQAGRTVVFAGVVFREGEWLAADSDGVIVLPQAPPEA